MEEKEFDYINMIPLIDVMLVLLTIVLMTSTFIMGGMIRVELPRVTGSRKRLRGLDPWRWIRRAGFTTTVFR